MIDYKIAYNKRSVTRVLILLMVFAGAFFTSLDFILQENNFWYPFTLTLLSLFLLILHQHFKYKHTNFLVFFIFLFWLSFISWEESDTAGIRVYFILAFGAPHMLFNSMRSRWTMGVLSLVAFIIIQVYRPTVPLPTTGIDNIYVFMHLLISGLVIFFALENFRKQVDKSAQSQNHLLAQSEDLNENLIKVNAQLNHSKEALEKSNEELRKVNLELFESQQELKEKNKSLETFSYVASHDLRTPLRSMISFQSLLKRKLNELKVDDPDINDYLDMSLQGSYNLNNILEKLLEFTRASNRKSLDLVHINVEELAEQVKREQLNQWGTDRVSIVIKVKDVLINSDREILYIIIHNLVNNGLKFNTSNRPEVSINATLDTSQTIISVSDNGIGIDQNYINSIFEPFKRLHSKSDFNGTGLGLAIVNSFITLLGGSIHVSSKPNHGTTIEVRIPFEYV